MSEIIQLYNEAETNNINNYRPIALILIALKSMHSVFLNSR